MFKLQIINQAIFVILPISPFYLLITILSIQDLNKCRSVCKSWQLVTSDECFGWINAFTIHFYKEEYTRRWSAASMLGGGGSGDGLTCPLGEGKIVSFSSVSVETVKKNAYYDLTYNCVCFVFVFVLFCSALLCSVLFCSK